MELPREIIKYAYFNIMKIKIYLTHIDYKCSIYNTDYICRKVNGA